MSHSVLGRTLALPSRVSRPRPGPPGTGTDPATTAGAVVPLFAVTIFLGAGLLFCVQPMVARMVLPTLGGTPAVWNTCMVFFQAALLAGYAYAHALSGRVAIRRQVLVHAALLALPLLVLPIGIGGGSAGAGPPPADAAPVVWLLGTLAATVGLPFFVVAATAPLLQRWFAETGEPSAADPYFLYAASNLGSMTALIGYPLALEPLVRLAWQGKLWSVGYLALAGLVVACGAASARRAKARPVAPASEESLEDATIGIRRRLRWVGLAFLPSSLMLGVTSYMTTDLAAVPLLWVIPLAIYLFTFILVFSRKAILTHEATSALLPPTLMLLAWTLASGAEPSRSLLALHLGTYFLVAMVCHGALAADRPPARGLTGFYLSMSVGGVLGGLFNALASPLLFDRIVEYPLVLGLSCLALPWRSETRSTQGRALPAALGAALIGVAVGRLAGGDAPVASLATKLAAGLAAVLAVAGFRKRPLGLCVACLALLATGFLPTPGTGRVLWRGRDFFGVLTVTENQHGNRNGNGLDHRLVHGRTLHGRQDLDPATASEPLSYYHRTGPAGDVFRALDARPGFAAEASVGVVGLGAGSLAAYAHRGQRWTFYEIDPAVARVARDTRFFTFLSRCEAGPPAIELGDARLTLRDARGRVHDLLVLDAFSSDAIPVHLLTREALAVYRGRLADHGLIAVHISNRYLDLAPVIAALAADAGLTCRVRSDLAVAPEADSAGKSASIWAVLAASRADLGPIADDPRWVAPASRSGGDLWTDDYSNIAARLLGLR